MPTIKIKIDRKLGNFISELNPTEIICQRHLICLSSKCPCSKNGEMEQFLLIQYNYQAIIETSVSTQKVPQQPESCDHIFWYVQ